MFFFKEASKDQPNILLIHSGSLPSLTFKGLRSIVVLGLDTIKHCNDFVTLAGRLRSSSSSLVPDELYPPFGESSKTSVECRLYILHEKPDFEFMERNFLERSLIKSGLVQQLSVVGVNESDFDQKLYDEDFRSDYEIYNQS